MKNKEKGVAAQFVPAGTPPPLFDQIKNPRSQEQGCGYSGRRPKRGIRVTGLHRRQDVTLVGAVARYCVKPLALSRFLRRGTAPACKNRSAAPGCRCPNILRGTRPACIFGRLPLLRFGCFCRRQRLSSAASGGSLFHPLDAVAAAAFAYFSSRKVRETSCRPWGVRKTDRISWRRAGSGGHS